MIIEHVHKTIVIYIRILLLFYVTRVSRDQWNNFHNINDRRKFFRNIIRYSAKSGLLGKRRYFKKKWFFYNTLKFQINFAKISIKAYYLYLTPPLWYRVLWHCSDVFYCKFKNLNLKSVDICTVHYKNIHIIWYTKISFENF